jgi:hypothetical protein
MTVWVLPEDTVQHAEAQDGDLLLRYAGTDLVVGRVLQGSLEWLGPVPAGALDVPPATEPTQAPELETALRPIAEAAAALGG